MKIDGQVRPGHGGLVVDSGNLVLPVQCREPGCKRQAQCVGTLKCRQHHKAHNLAAFKAGAA